MFLRHRLMPKAPDSHLCEQRYKLYGRFREVVDPFLLMIRTEHSVSRSDSVKCFSRLARMFEAIPSSFCSSRAP